jgi:RHS repeat-associated protein
MERGTSNNYSHFIEGEITMTKYANEVVGDNIKPFDYNGKTYKAGDVYEASDACDALAFYAALSNENHEGTKIDGSKDAWKKIEEECGPPIEILVSGSSVPPVELNPVPSGGDTAKKQGAPMSSSSAATIIVKPIEADTSTFAAPDEEPTRPPNGEPHPTQGGENSRDHTNAGEPVDIFTGTFYLQEIDLEIPNTILPLSFMRVYRSGDATFGPFGWNWDHNYNLYIRELTNGNIALWRNLHEDIFKFDGINFEPPRGVFEKLYRVTGTTQSFEITGEEGTVMHFERPPWWTDGERIPLVWIKDRHNNKLAFSYGVEDKLAEVRDDDDRFFKFEYDRCGLVVAVSDHAGRKYEYGHDEQSRQLISVKRPSTFDYPDGTTTSYNYEQPFAPPELRHNITSIKDSDGNFYVENKYEQDPSSWDYARVIEQLYGGYLFQFRYIQLQWNPSNPVYINIPALRVEVLNPDFGLQTYTFNYRGDLLDRRYRLNKDKSFRVVAWQYEFDEQGNLSITTMPDGGQEINVYDFSNPDPRMRGKLLQREITSSTIFPSPSRIVWKAKYESIYQLLKEETNEAGIVTKYRYDFDLSPGAITNSGKLMEIIHPNATLPDGTVQKTITKYEYNNKGQTKAIILGYWPNQVRHENVYGDSGFQKSRLISLISDVGGLNIENKIGHDVFGYDNKRTDGKGNSTQKVFNALGLIEKAILTPIDGVQAEYRLHYNSDKKVIRTERPKGLYMDPLIKGNHIIDKFDRDVLGYIIKYHLSSNTIEKRTIRGCPDFRGFPIEIFNPDGSRIKWIHDERGLTIKEEVIGADNKKLVSKKVYNRSGKLMQETDAIGLTTKYEYDGFSRIHRVTLPNGTQVIHTWRKGDLLESQEVIGEDGFGNNRQLSKKTYTYDEKGRRITETVKSFRDNPATSIDIITTFYYDNLDRIERIIDNRGGIKAFHYDGVGRLKVETDPMGNEGHFTYDNNGNLTQLDNHHHEPDGTVSILKKRFGYDARNRRTESIQPDGAKLIDIYDDRDLVIRKIDYSGIVRETTYNSFQNRISETYDVGGLNVFHQWTLDNMSRITSYIDPMNQISHYYFDSLGRNYKTEYPNGFSVTRTYNSVGQIREELLGSKVKFEYGYDTSNRLTSIKNTESPAAINQVQSHGFIYDGLDRAVFAKAGSNEVVRKYDSANRLLSEKTHGVEIKCNYDDNAGTVEKIWPDGRTEKYSHDLNGILSKIEETVNGTLGTGASLIASIKPSGSCYLGEFFYQGGLKVVGKYDERKRLVELKVTSPVDVDEKIKYRYDKANKKKIDAILGRNSKISFYEFDNKYRLSTAKDGFTAIISEASTQAEHDLAINAIKIASSGATHEEKFYYDPADARTEHSETGVVKKYTYLPGHRIQNDGKDNCTYHIDGTLQNDGRFTYEADALGRIITVKSGINEVCKLEYDAFNRPSVVHEVGKPAKSLNYFGSFIEQENDGGIASRQISVQPVTGIPIAYHSKLGTHYTLFDNRYNLIGLANTSGELLETFRYASFGIPEIKNSAGLILPASAFGVEPIFGGQKFLSSAKLYLSKRRLMNPTNGVFLSQDSDGYTDSPSSYVYAAQDPINNIDPTGEILAIAAVVIIAGFIAGGIYSMFDSADHPEKYEGAAAIWRPTVNMFGGAAIAGAAFLGGEAILAIGGIGVFASGTGATLTVGESFVLYGASSAYSGAVLRGGFNTMFPEYVDPVTSRTATIDFVSGGAIGAGLRGLTNLAAPGTNFGVFRSIPRGGTFSQWVKFGDYIGGETPIIGELGPYPGRLGAWLDRMGLANRIHQGYESKITNWDHFARINALDTGFHEAFHAWFARYFPTLRNLSRVESGGAIARYPEEVIAFGLGRLRVGRVHAVPFAPFEAFRSVERAYESIAPGSVAATKIFWGRLTGALGVGAAEKLFSNDEKHPNETVISK